MKQSTTIKTPLSRGVITIVATVFAMALADAVVKHSSAGLTLWQIWVLRSLIVIPILVILARKSILPTGLAWVVLRSLILVLMYLGIYAAIPLLDLSIIAAALYTGPLFIVCLSAVVLHERISGRHWMSILIGFAGVLLIVRPTASGFSLLTLLPVAAAFLYALAAVLTRAKCGAIPATTMALWLNTVLLGVGGVASMTVSLRAAESDYPFLFGHWQPMAASDWWLIIVLAVLMIGVSIGFAMAYQSPRPQVIATFDYAYLIFAGLWGYLFFGELPDLYTVGGMVLIVGAGMAVLYVRPTNRSARPPTS